MKQSAILTVASLLSILFLTFHLAGDIVYGYEKGVVSNLIAVPFLVLWLFGISVLGERRSGHIITLVFSFLAMVVPVIHMTGKGAGLASRMAHSDGHFFFVWTLIALAVTALFSVVLAARGLWR